MYFFFYFGIVVPGVKVLGGEAEQWVTTPSSRTRRNSFIMLHTVTDHYSQWQSYTQRKSKETGGRCGFVSGIVGCGSVATTTHCQVSLAIDSLLFSVSLYTRDCVTSDCVISDIFRQYAVLPSRTYCIHIVRVIRRNTDYDVKRFLNTILLK